MSTAEIFSIIKDIALAGAACTTAYVAFTGLEKWQKELSGKASFDVARELAKSAYFLRDEIRYCRSPITAAHEFPDKYREGNKHTPQENGDAWAYVYAKRWESVVKALQSFDLATLEAEALWGKEIKQRSIELQQCVKSLRVDVDTFIRNEFSGGEVFRDKNLASEVQNGVWDVKPEENELTKRINNAIDALERVIRPHLSRNI
jgi:hypothetical protein